MRILIEVPTYDGRISQATSQSLWTLDKCGHTVDYKPRTGYGCAMARNRIAADAINARYDRVMMVDNDIALPPDALANLLEHDADFAMGWYMNRYGKDSRVTTLYKPEGGWHRYDADELLALRDAGTYALPVKGGGMGCALLRTSLFERLEFPWFQWRDIDFEEYFAVDAYGCTDRFTSGGEDIEFCNLCRTSGVEIIADTRVACGHEFREVRWPE